MDYTIIKKIIKDAFKIDTINYGESKVLTFAHDNDRSFLYNNKYYSPLIDTIEDDMAKNGVKNCVSIARIISKIKGDLSYGNVHSPEGRFARALLVKRFSSLFSGQNYPYSHMEERIWGEILDETKAVKAIGILPGREFCVACHKRGVWVADVQHGVIAENHHWYGKKFRAKDKRELLPNAFCVWDKGSAEVLESWAVEKGIEVKIIGNRWLARFRKASPDDKLVNDTIKKFLQNFKKDENKKTILVSLSWGSLGLSNGIISEELIKVIQTTANQYQWLLRLHPNQMKGFAEHEFKIFHKLFQDKLADYSEWEVPTSMALPAVLLNIDLHISWNSSIAIEASQLGLKSAMLDPELSRSLAGDYFDYYKNLGFVDFVKNEKNDIINWISANINNKFQGENYDPYDAKYQELISFLIA